MSSGGELSALAASDPMITDEVPRISREDVAEGIGDRTVTAVDTRQETNYRRQHLPGAVNIPGFPYDTTPGAVDRLAPGLLPDKKAVLALYCVNPPCRNSEFVGRRLRTLGYTNVFKYADGIQDWIDAGLPTEGTSAGN